MATEAHITALKTAQEKAIQRLEQMLDSNDEVRALEAARELLKYLPNTLSVPGGHVVWLGHVTTVAS